MWKLIDQSTEAEVAIGSSLTTFRGNVGILESWEAPKHAASTGRIYMRFPDDGFVQSFFPSVCGLKIVEVPEPQGYPDIKVGDVVKSYDFPDNTDCYIVGQVTAIGPVTDMGPDLNRYHIRTMYRIWRGEVDSRTDADYCFPPVNGTPTLLNRIAKGVVPFWD